MEASPNCEYDRLEIRNGQHGYSDLLTTLCGHNFPQEIHSTDNYLWLRFVSDETIEYEGFKGVYTFLRQASKLFTCGHTLLCAHCFNSLTLFYFTSKLAQIDDE